VFELRYRIPKADEHRNKSGRNRFRGIT